MPDPVDFDAYRRRMLEQDGATYRQVDTDFDEYLSVGSFAMTGRPAVCLDNSQHDGFVMTPDEAEELAARLLKLAKEARGG